MSRRRALPLLLAAATLAGAGCGPAQTDVALANNADTMDRNMALKADRLESMADEASSAMAENMIDNADIGVNATAPDTEPSLAGASNDGAR